MLNTSKKRNKKSLIGLLAAGTLLGLTSIAGPAAAQDAGGNGGGAGGAGGGGTYAGATDNRNDRGTDLGWLGLLGLGGLLGLRRREAPAVHREGAAKAY